VADRILAWIREPEVVGSATGAKGGSG